MSHSLDMLANYDWPQAFGYAKDFTIEDVAEIIDYRDGENDEANWIMYGKLKDGRYFTLSAGCDYTGWDCQAGGTSETADTLEKLIRFGMGDDERDRYGLKLPEQSSHSAPEQC